jgi:hypothetical protein
VSFDRQLLAAKVAHLAAQGVYVGTSSWKYPGWCGMLYDRTRYEYRGKFAETRFNRGCLAEYAEVFKTVCVDAAYYTFPSQTYLEGLAIQVPKDFLFGFNGQTALRERNGCGNRARNDGEQESELEGDCKDCQNQPAHSPAQSGLRKPGHS